MKRPILLFLVISFIFANRSFAQILYTSADMPVIGDVVVQYVDTLFGVDQDAGNAGPDQTWDYSGSLNHYSISTAFMSVASTPYASAYPTANMASTTDSSIYNFLNSQPASLSMEGLAGPIVTASDTTHMSPDQTLYQLSSTYLSNFTDNYLIDYQGDGSNFGVYAFRYVSHGIIYDSTDAFGILKTPMGTYNTLRVKRHDVATDSIFIKFASALEPWSLYQSYTSDQLSFKWLANGIKLPVAEVATDNTGHPTTFTYTAALGTFGVETQNSQQIKVGPNPAKESISIFIPVQFANVDLRFEILDVNGKIVYNKNIQQSEQVLVDISFLHSGVYLYRLSSTTQTFSGKIIKE